ncbi:MAG TPA: hypothetical protein VN088_16285 [Nocardioides sp.]|nr:hypothetical protein [Nocardioides sp.]
MGIILSTADRNTLGADAAALFNGGAASVYTGASPGPDNAATGTLLITFALPNPFVPAAFATGVGTVGAVASAVAGASGNAGYVRFTDSGGSVICDGDVGTTGSGAAMEFSTLAIVSGDTIQVTGGTITEPGS